MKTPKEALKRLIETVMDGDPQKIAECIERDCLPVLNDVNSPISF